MWKWTCPKTSRAIWESHSKRDGLEVIAMHVGGYAPLNVPPCEEIHTVTDDGVPCDQESFTGEPCTIPYVRDVD